MSGAGNNGILTNLHELVSAAVDVHKSDVEITVTSVDGNSVTGMVKSIYVDGFSIICGNNEYHLFPLSGVASIKMAFPNS